MKRIVVIQANGYIGCHVAKALLALETEVVAVDFSTKDVDTNG